MNNKLGFGVSDRLLIINADDFGLTKGTNEAIVHAYERKTITSASIMMPCAASREAIQLCLQKRINDIGIHLTLTSDGNHQYRPIFQGRALQSLTTSDGYFYSESFYLETHADLEEVRMELDAQIHRAVILGIDPTHLDSHGGSIMGIYAGRDFLEITIDLCEKYALPLNLPSRIVDHPFFSNTQKQIFQQRLESARQRGILFIDDLVTLPYCSQPFADYDLMKKQLITIIKNVKPGITQLTVHPSLVTEELKMITKCYLERKMEYDLLNDPDIKQVFEEECISLISWKDIRELQRCM